MTFSTCRLGQATHPILPLNRSTAQVAFGLLISPRAVSPTPRSATAPKASPDVLLAFVLLTFAALVVRLEMIALIAPLALDAWLRKMISLPTLLGTGAAAASASLGERRADRHTRMASLT